MKKTIRTKIKAKIYTFISYDINQQYNQNNQLIYIIEVRAKIKFIKNFNINAKHKS